MLRSAASPGSVGFGRLGGGVSGLLMTPLPAGHLAGGLATDPKTLRSISSSLRVRLSLARPLACNIIHSRLPPADGLTYDARPVVHERDRRSPFVRAKSRMNIR